MSTRKSRASLTEPVARDEMLHDAYGALCNESRTSLVSARDADVAIIAKLESECRALELLVSQRRSVLNIEEQCARESVAEAEAAHRTLFIGPAFDTEYASVRAREVESLAWTQLQRQRVSDCEDLLSPLQ